MDFYTVHSPCSEAALLALKVLNSLVNRLYVKPEVLGKMCSEMALRAGIGILITVRT